ncbi:flagellar assembly protein FliW [Hydrogenophilus thiooxidans]|uniref:flagellar assembly protein FliW n=1 Tax=Hydrogenophilus thiooxidans TaxID=2820326 RepID=UPI001C210381|nr:flagellar assembly protein FliW [Hydrogenophilus thiooxidans]
MKLTSPVLGEIEVDDSKVIHFPNGLAGLEHLKRFVLAHEEPAQGEMPRVFILQSVDEPEIAFSLVVPESLGVRYELELSDAEVALLQATAPEEIVIAVIVRRDEAQPDSHGLKANFMGPILINSNTRKAMQKVLDRFNCDIVIRG